VAQPLPSARKEVAGQKRKRKKIRGSCEGPTHGLDSPKKKSQKSLKAKLGGGDNRQRPQSH